MRESTVTEAQIVAILREAKAEWPWPTSSVSTGSVVGRFTSGRSTGASESLSSSASWGGAGEGVLEAYVRGPGPRVGRHQGCAQPKTVTRTARRAVVTIQTREHALPCAARPPDRSATRSWMPGLYHARRGSGAAHGDTATTPMGPTRVSATCRP